MSNNTSQDDILIDEVYYDYTWKEYLIPIEVVSTERVEIFRWGAQLTFGLETVPQKFIFDYFSLVRKNK